MIKIVMLTFILIVAAIAAPLMSLSIVAGVASYDKNHSPAFPEVQSLQLYKKSAE